MSRYPSLRVAELGAVVLNSTGWVYGGWVGSATFQEGGKGRLFSLPFLCSEQPVGIGQNPEGDFLLAVLVGVL